MLNKNPKQLAFLNQRSRQFEPSGKKRFDSQGLRRLVEDKNLRLEEHPDILQLIELVASDPEDLDLQGMLFQRIDHLKWEHTQCGDVFHGNYPVRGRIQYPPDFRVFGVLPTGDSAGLADYQLKGNVSFIGKTGIAKTSCLMQMLINNPSMLDCNQILAICKKPELRELATVAGLQQRVKVFVKRDIAIGFLCPGKGVPVHAFDRDVVKNAGQTYQKFSAQRFLGKIIESTRQHLPEGSHPTLGQIIEVMESYRCHPLSREGQYKDSMLSSLTDLLQSAEGIFEYSQSNFLEALLSNPGLSILELPDFGADHFSFVATYIMRWLYLKRLYTEQINL